MIFSELYSIYYRTVGNILEEALENGMSDKALKRAVSESAFMESSLQIVPALKEQRWQLLDSELKPIIRRSPTVPLTTLEKRWLKAISLDPRIKLFDAHFPELDNVRALFTPDDYRVFDKYSDGDDFEDESYIRIFRTLLNAIKQGKPVIIHGKSKNGKMYKSAFFPVGLEYSAKDDKFRVLSEGHKQYNLARITSCEICNMSDIKKNIARDSIKELTLSITDRRNALERTMLHFAHFEKQAMRGDDGNYILRLKYYQSDETEMVIRVLSFGAAVKVTEPESFVNLIKERLVLQKSCGLR